MKSEKRRFDFYSVISGVILIAIGTVVAIRFAMFEQSCSSGSSVCPNFASIIYLGIFLIAAGILVAGFGLYQTQVSTKEIESNLPSNKN